jgi:hypothetical protein
MNLKGCLSPSGRASAILLIGMAVLFYQPLAGAVDSVAPREWPPTRLGLWKLETTRIFPNGKTKHWTETAHACSDASDLFMGYWGGGIVEIEGCRYTPVKVASDKFRITTECFVRGARRPSDGEADVTMHGLEAFEMKGAVTERKKTYRLTQGVVSPFVWKFEDGAFSRVLNNPGTTPDCTGGMRPWRNVPGT